MNTRLVLSLTHSKFDKIIMKGGCHCLLPTFRVHPVTHLLSFALGGKGGENPSPTEEQLPLSTIQKQALFLLDVVRQ